MASRVCKLLGFCLGAAALTWLLVPPGLEAQSQREPRPKRNVQAFTGRIIKYDPGLKRLILQEIKDLDVTRAAEFHPNSKIIGRRLLFRVPADCNVYIDNVASKPSALKAGMLVKILAGPGPVSTTVTGHRLIQREPELPTDRAVKGIARSNDNDRLSGTVTEIPMAVEIDATTRNSAGDLAPRSTATGNRRR